MELSLSANCNPVLGIQHFLWGRGQAGNLVSHSIQVGTMIGLVWFGLFIHPASH